MLSLAPTWLIVLDTVDGVTGGMNPRLRRLLCVPLLASYEQGRLSEITINLVTVVFVSFAIMYLVRGDKKSSVSSGLKEYRKSGTTNNSRATLRKSHPLKFL